jgi:hypothetical protein
MTAKTSFKSRHWLALAAALFVLNAAVTFHNIWPTLWIKLRPEVSVELGVLLLALIAWATLVRPLGRAAWVFITLLVIVFMLGRYAEVTAPALYGRPVNLYWDSEHLPKVGAMLAEVAPPWLLALYALGALALAGTVTAVIAWAVAAVLGALRAPWARGALAALAIAIVAVYALGRALDWPTRFKYSLPVTKTFLQQVEFIRDAYMADLARSLPNSPLASSTLGRLGGDDVLLVFLESYGAVTYDAPAIARVVAPARDELAHAAAATGRHVLSAYVSSPTFGGGSWLAHASFMSGLEVRDPGDYMLLLTQQRDTWAKAFRSAGYRAIAVMPGTRSAWPEGSFYGFDAIYDAQSLAYRGPAFGWWQIPDQFSLASIGVLEEDVDSHMPLFAFLSTINTHIPFLPVPPYQTDWQRLLGEQPFEPADVAASLAQTPDWEALGGPYAEAFVYTFTYLAGYLRLRPGADETLLLIGDHQPAASVTGLDARWDVPVHIVTRRDDIAAALLAAGFVKGVALAPQQRPIATISELSALLLKIFDSPQ